MGTQPQAEDSFVAVIAQSTDTNLFFYAFATDEMLTTDTDFINTHRHVSSQFSAGFHVPN